MNQPTMTEYSIVEYFSAHEKYRCGYCKHEDTCYSYGLWGHTLTALDYQCLIDRGWRRSGKYCYKPTMHLTCCPQYTIRCEALKFTLSRSQKKVLKKVHKYLANGERERKSSSHSSESSDQQMDISDIPESVDVEMLKSKKKASKLSRSDIEASQAGSPKHSTDLPQEVKETSPASPTRPPTSESSHTVLSHTSSPTKSNPDKPCRKAKEIRRERKLQKLLSKGIPMEEALTSVQKKPSEPKSVEDFLNEPFPAEPMFKLELRLVPSNPDSDEFSSTYDESYALFRKYQMSIHNETEKDCEEDAYQDFLIESPFELLDGVSSSETGMYGSFHQQYWLNGKLIAVAVLDILTYCVSSVYFYYDPDYSFLSLGTYASLREIALTRELNKKHPEIQYYYMGYYIHSCVKMKYKGQYHPSYLLCPETYIFQPIEKCKPKLDKAKYSRLEEDPNKVDQDGVVNLCEVMVLHNHKRMPYTSYRKEKKQADDEAEVREYAGFVGKKCYRRMLLFRN